MKQTLFILFLFSTIFSQENPIGKPSQLTGLLLTDDATRMLIHESSGDIAHRTVQELSLYHRFQNSLGIDKALDYIHQKAKQVGLEDVQFETYPNNDTVWTPIKGELWVTKPYVFKVASYDDIPLTFYRNSGNGEFTTKLVDIKDLSDKSLIDSTLQGKMILTDVSSWATYSKVHKFKPKGLISTIGIPYWDAPNRMAHDFPNQVGWSGGFSKPKDVNNAPVGFNLSLKNHEILKNLVRKGPVEVKVVSKVKYEPWDMKLVSGVITGSKYPDEEIIITAHIDHYRPGSNDNASGSAAILEIVRTYKKLINEGKLPQPLRTLRFIWLPEFSGSEEWIKRHKNDPKKYLVNLNFDMLGSDIKKADSSFKISYTPNNTGSYINGLMSSILDFMNLYNRDKYPNRNDFHIISASGSRQRFNGSMEKASRGSDNQVFNDNKIPAVAMLTWPDNFYHTNEDTPDKVDPTQLHRSIFVGLSSLTTIAYTQDANIKDLIHSTYSQGIRRVKSEISDLKKLFFLTARSELSEKLYITKESIRYLFNREIQSINSCLDLSNDNRNIKIAKKYIALLNENYKDELDQFVTVSSLYYGNIDHYELTQKEKEAKKIIPKYVKGKEATSFWTVRKKASQKYRKELLKLNTDFRKMISTLRKKNVEELRMYDLVAMMLTYTDGKKSILDIRDEFYSEYGYKFPIDGFLTLYKMYLFSGVMK